MKLKCKYQVSEENMLKCGHNISGAVRLTNVLLLDGG